MVVQDAVDAAVGVVQALHGAASLPAALAAPGRAADSAVFVDAVDSVQVVAASFWWKARPKQGEKGRVVSTMRFLHKQTGRWIGR